MWLEIWERHSAKIIGAACGVLLGLIYLIVGFWDMLIFAFIVFVGYYIGSKLDRREPMLSFDELRRWLTERWGMFR